MTDIKELRTRARAIGYRTIRKRGTYYWLINTDGESEVGADSVNGMARVLDQVEAFNAGAVRVTTTACGRPLSASDENGEVELDDPRVIEALAAA
jgi:hypothetical protein